MSAFMCTDKHFGYLVGALKLYGNPPGSGRLFQREHLDALAGMLKHENALSLAARYPSDKPCEHCGLKACQPTTKVMSYNGIYTPPDIKDHPEGGCPFGDVERYAYEALDINPVTAIKAAKCYAYQACEHEGWETSAAKRFIDDLIEICIHALPGYEEAPWGM